MIKQVSKPNLISLMRLFVQKNKIKQTTFQKKKNRKKNQKCCNRKNNKNISQNIVLGEV